MKIWATMTSIILLSGMLGLGFSPVAFAEHNENGNGFAKGCDNKNDNGNKENNPHCDTGPPPDPLPANACDNNPMDGAITAAELAVYLTISPSDAQLVINAATATVTNGNNVIDTAPELVELNKLIDPDC